MRCERLFRLTAMMLIGTMLNGCLAADMVGELAQGEALVKAESFVLTRSENAYEITLRWSTGGDKTLSIPRRDLPTGSEGACFFLNTVTRELQVAQPVNANWITGNRPPQPDDSYPPCAMLVSFGAFSEPQPLEGLAVTSATGLIATDELKKPQPAAWALLPVALVTDVFIFVGALVTIPVWAPIGILWEKNVEKREQESKKKEKGVLPSPVAACWTAIDDEMKKSRYSNPDNGFIRFEWSSGRENSYAVTTANELFSDDAPVPVDLRVTLRQGRVKFFRSLWTDSDVECGLQSGNVVATRVMLLK